MSDLNRFRTLSAEEQAMVAMAVLFDGHDSAEYLLSEKKRGVVLSKSAQDLLSLPIDLRLSLSGTLLRQALEKINKSANE